MTKIYNTPWFNQKLNELLVVVEGYYPDFAEKQRDMVVQAFWFAKEAHQAQKRFSGEPYFTHPIAATQILLTIRPDIETICACLLHDVIEDTPVTAAEIRKAFGDKVGFLCEGVEKVSKVNLKEDQKGQKLETIKKLFMAVAEDIRVIFIKLADRIHNLQTLGAVRPEKRRRIARESLEIYAPTAGQLGLFAFKQQIEDLCFEHLHPEEFTKITKEISEHLEAQQEFIEKGKEVLQKAMKKRGVSVIEIKGRRKHLHSIYEKLRRKNYSYATDLFDLVGFRVMVKTTPTCYRALGAIHSQWTPMPRRFKDYISSPKPNGYQSLHTTVLGFGGAKLPTEIQIRTQKMHLDAEFGPAAHWAYKKSKSSNFDADYRKRTSWFPERIKGKVDMPADEFFTSLSQQVLSDKIYVFTPKGDTITLKKGSTCVDFGFAIHTEVGSSMVGAKVNGIMKPIDSVLNKGDIVEVLTKIGKTPNPAWLEFVKTSMARQYIQGFINKQRKAEGLLIEKERTKEKEDGEHIGEKLKKLRSELKKTIQNEEHLPLWAPIMIGGETNIPHRIATCCSPAPYQHIIAYKSRGLDYTIHNKKCEQLDILEKERMMDAVYLRNFGLEVTQKEGVRGLGRGIMKTLTQYDAHLLSAEPKNGTYVLKGEVAAKKSIRKMIEKLQNLPDVEKIKEVFSEK